MADTKDVKPGADTGNGASPASTTHKEIDIPVLKKEDKKKGGVNLNFGNQAASGSGVAAGGSGSAASSAVSAASQAAASAGKIASTAAGELGKASIKGLFSNLSGTFSTLLATTAGKVAAAVVVLGLGGGAAAVFNSSGVGSGSAGGVILAPINSSVIIDKPADKALKYAAESGKKDEDIKFDEPKNKKNKKDGKEGGNSTGSLERSGAGGGLGEGGPVSSSDAAMAENAAGDAAASEGGPAGDQMERSYGGMTGEVGRAASGAALDKSQFGGKGLAGMREFEKANAGVGKGKAGGIRSIARNMKLDDQIMTNAGGRRLDKTGLQRLRKMLDYNKLMTKTGVNEAATEASATQFDGMEVSEQAKAPVSPKGTSVNPNKMGSGGESPVTCRAPMINQGGFCACPEGTMYTSDGGSCGVTGEDRTQWAEMLDDIYKEIDDAKKDLMILLGIISLLMILSAIFWSATYCSGGFLGFIMAAMIAYMLFSQYQGIQDKLDGIADKADAIKKMPGGHRIGEAAGNMSDKLSSNATMAFWTTFGGALIVAAIPAAGYAWTGIVMGVVGAGFAVKTAVDMDKAKDDLKDDAGTELREQCKITKDKCLKTAQDSKFDDPEKECDKPCP